MLPLFHTYVNGDVPLVTVDVIEPLGLPQVANEDVRDTDGFNVVVIEIDCATVQPLLSVTVTVYVPALTFTRFCSVAPFDHE